MRILKNELWVCLFAGQSVVKSFFFEHNFGWGENLPSPEIGSLNYLETDLLGRTFIFNFSSSSSSFKFPQSNDARTSPKDHLLMGGGSRNNRDYSNCLDSISDQTTFQHSASSVESLPSASGSSEWLLLVLNIDCYEFTRNFLELKNYSTPAGTQALVRPGSPHSSLSAEDRTTMIPICRAIALIDSNPNPYDKEALRFKVSIPHVSPSTL